MATVYLDIPRKSLGQLQVIRSTDAGETWATVTGTLDSVKNQLAVDAEDTDIVMLSSTAFAKQTTESVNSPVLHGGAGLGGVYSTSFHEHGYGACLQESLVGKVPTGNIALAFWENMLTGFKIYPDWRMQGYSSVAPTHTPIQLAGVSSPAVKSLSYQVANNNQASMNFAFNELVWDTDVGDWGDDSKVYIADGVTTGTDLNGNTRLIGTHTLALPYGWVRNTI
ncbi:hypothetical protein NVP1238A_17 [Vibrio phage 1.238.A._10N.261.52.F10]|uniref:Uncharacterized protein n=1 Tax=Vibrio phage 1.238.A._10N.261.52.F10 TaxID=1881231 RepID=A0A2I7RUC3_9CAUD|nr:hypothetical protein KNT79_gp17 [Vibrio phage 1.238.A._10N.261.52.F10]AUR97266.1 hypothetical protein NVP1238A_17 [Vibrio phage 1.238.A._10N.261.52.F10]AUR97360.1 hypothetical protein NVP1238B_18 [Vibrio phage 1.238.B._10N.261.52.F10]